MPVHGVDGHDESLCDLLVGKAVGDQSQDLLLALAERASGRPLSWLVDAGASAVRRRTGAGGRPGVKAAMRAVVMRAAGGRSSSTATRPGPGQAVTVRGTGTPDSQGTIRANCTSSP